MSNCIFCKIVAGEAPTNVVYEDDLVLAILDINPISNGHTLIIPKKDALDLHVLDATNTTTSSFTIPPPQRVTTSI